MFTKTIMDSCLLCLELNKDLVDFIEANSIQWQELNITNVLEKHFWPLNTMNTKSWMCCSCWHHLDDFNKFYLRIEEAHTNFGRIKMEENQFEPKDEVSSNESEHFSYSCLEQEMLIDPKAVEILSDNRESSEIKDNIDINEQLTNKDPLVKTKVTKTRNRKVAKTSDTSKSNSISQHDKESKIKTEPNDALPEDNSDSMNDEDEDGDYEPDTNSLDSTKDRDKSSVNHKKNDKFIAEHFKQMFCDLCEGAFPFESFAAMQKHFESVHDQKGYLVCCDKKFFQRYRLVDHLHIHLNPDHFKCNHCGKVLSNRDNFQKHMLRMHRPNGVNLTHFCEICGKSFVQASLLRNHKLKHLPEEEKKFPCTQCGKFYASAYHLNIHTEAVHLKKSAKICYICGKSISTSAEFKIHMDKHEGIPQPTISCDICGLRLTSERGLKRHKENQHPVGGKQDHPCPVCHKISPTQKALRKHINTMHEKGYDHKCTICGKAFKRAEVLREHMASHTGTPLYTCLWCPKTFNSNGNMHAHRKKVHPKEWEEAKLEKYSGNLPKELKISENS